MKKYRFNGELQALLLILESSAAELDKSTHSFREVNDRLEYSLKGYNLDEEAHRARMNRILTDKRDNK